MMGEIIKRFESKKNSVFLVSVEGIMQVVKVHESEEKAYFESRGFKRLLTCMLTYQRLLR